jgi:hypothetical protein
MTPAQNRWGVPTNHRGDIDFDWIDGLHQRLFHCLEQDIAVLERAQEAGPDPSVAISKNLKLLEQYFKVCRLARQSCPERQKPRGKRRQNGR